jgi:hypothetical protein
MLLTWLSPLTRTDEKAQDERLAIKVQSREGKKRQRKENFVSRPQIWPTGKMIR